jgi:cyclic pyranopterin phosphate synthase
VYDSDIRKNLEELKQIRGENSKPFIYIKKIEGEDDQEFLDQYSDLADEIAIEKKHNWLDGKEGDSVCPQPFKMMSIRYTGDVIVCDPDWENNTKVGNVLETSLKEIWEGPELKAFWKMQLEHRRRENKSCRTCTFVDNEFYVKDKL